MNLSKIGGWLTVSLLAAQVYAAPTLAPAVKSVTVPVTQVMSALQAADAKAAQAAFNTALGGNAPAHYLAAIGILYKNTHGANASTDIAGIQLFVSQQNLSGNVLLSSVAELTKKGEKITIANLKTTQSIANYTASLAKNQEVAQATGLPKAKAVIGTDGAALVGDLSPVAAAEYFKNMTLSGPAAEVQARNANCDTTECTIESSNLGSVAAAMARTCELVSIPDCKAKVQTSFEEWVAGTYNGVLKANKEDATNGSDFAKKVYANQLGYHDKTALVNGWLRLTKLSAKDPVAYYQANPHMGTCVRGKEPAASKVLAN